MDFEAMVRGNKEKDPSQVVIKQKVYKPKISLNLMAKHTSKTGFLNRIYSGRTAIVTAALTLFTGCAVPRFFGESYRPITPSDISAAIQPVVHPDMREAEKLLGNGDLPYELPNGYIVGRYSGEWCVHLLAGVYAGTGYFQKGNPSLRGLEKYTGAYNPRRHPDALNQVCEDLDKNGDGIIPTFHELSSFDTRFIPRAAGFGRPLSLEELNEIRAESRKGLQPITEKEFEAMRTPWRTLLKNLSE